MLSLASRGFVTKEEFVELSKQMEDTVNAATTLLENLLGWAKNQIQGVEVKAVEVELSQLIEENFGMVKYQAEKKGISLSNLVEQSFRVLADEEMTNLVIRNLLSNALKFTPSGGAVQVSARLNGQYVGVTVKDTGVGIPEENRKKIFSTDAFTTHGTAREKGSGLGLNLCKEFIEKMGGELWFESQQGNGTTFFFTLPSEQ